MPVTLDALALDLDGEVVLPARGPVGRLGLALEADADVVAWARAQRVEALWVHRTHDLPRGLLDGIGVVGSHDAFDAAIPGWLAQAVGLRHPAPLLDDARALVGECPEDLRERVRTLLGGEEDFVPGEDEEPLFVGIVAGAMTDSLVRAADEAGAGLYVTGQWRLPAADAVAETAMAVQVCGHERLERWALAHFAEGLAATHEGLECLLAPAPEPRRVRPTAR